MLNYLSDKSTKEMKRKQSNENEIKLNKVMEVDELILPVYPIGLHAASNFAEPSRIFISKSIFCSKSNSCERERQQFNHSVKHNRIAYSFLLRIVWR